MKPEDFFQALWEQFRYVAPQAQKIQSLFLDLGETISNDHVAFRTFNKDGFGLDALTVVFENIGYQIYDSYVFPDKHIKAHALRIASEPEHPKIFISELVCEKLSDRAQTIIEGLTSKYSSKLSLESLLGTYPFHKPTFEQYSIVANENEYAAWLITMGYQANHFTLSVNALQSLNSIEDVITLLDKNNYALNTVGGLIKGDPEDLLVQVATLADKINFEFSDGTKKLVPSCFYEFAQRFKDSSGILFQGFIPANASAIFESTNRNQFTKRV